jgi:hypothetical protein
MNDQIDRIQERVGSLKQRIIDHRVYAGIRTLEDIGTFMQYHVFAVWDFMSLLKALQNNLTCTSIPWFPKGEAETRFLINEIVVGEESDIDSGGRRTSHFELYLDAMRQCGADTSTIRLFLEVLQQTGDLSASFGLSHLPAAVREFVTFTFDVINSGKSHVQAAVFTFGREDLIPGMFLSLVKDVERRFPGKISIFQYYLERHIEVDGDHHSKLALKMTATLCRDDEQRWMEAECAVIQALQKRIALWDAVAEQIEKANL